MAEKDGVGSASTSMLRCNLDRCGDMNPTRENFVLLGFDDSVIKNLKVESSRNILLEVEEEGGRPSMKREA